MSSVRWFLWVFMVLATIDMLVDIEVAQDFLLCGERGRFRHRVVCVVVKLLLVVWAFRLAFPGV